MTLQMLNEKATKIFQDVGGKKISDYYVFASFTDHLYDKRSKGGGKANNNNINDRVDSCEETEKKEMAKNKCKAKPTGDKDTPCAWKCAGSQLKTDGAKLNYDDTKNKCTIEFIGDKNPCAQHNISSYEGEYRRVDEFQLTLKGDKTKQIISKAIKAVIDAYSSDWKKLPKLLNGKGLKYGVTIEVDFNLIRDEAVKTNGISDRSTGHYGIIVAMSHTNEVSNSKEGVVKYNKKKTVKASIVTIYPLQNSRPSFSDSANKGSELRIQIS